MRWKAPDRGEFAAAPAAILLDLDGTLYPYAPADRTAMDAVRRKGADLLGLAGARFDEAFLQARADVKAQLGAVAASHSRLLYFQRMLEMLGMRSQPLLALDFEQTYWRSFLPAMRLHNDVNGFFATAKEMGIRLGLVTNLTAQIQFRKLVYLGLDRYFDIIVTSEEAGADKPAAAPFLLARDRLLPGADGPVWMVGDDAETDLAGAKRHLGARTFLLASGGPGAAEHACVDIEFREFTELMNLLEALGGKTAAAPAEPPLPATGRAGN